MNLGTPLDTPSRRGSAAVHATALMPTGGSRRGGRRWLTDPARRFLNVLVAGVASVTLAPLMPLIAVLVGLSSRGPVIYRQPRVGLDRRTRRSPRSENGRRRLNRGGRIFMICKFRTMVDDPGAGQVWAARDDPRVTKIGRVLRTARLDELPQFFNVLKGDMNIVGPRPEQPEIFSELRNLLPAYGERESVLPGITGLAQVSAGYDRSLEDVRRKIKFDLEYTHRCSVLHDLTIMARTRPVMAFTIRPVRTGASYPIDLVPSTGTESTVLVRED